MVWPRLEFFGFLLFCDFPIFADVRFSDFLLQLVFLMPQLTYAKFGLDCFNRAKLEKRHGQTDTQKNVYFNRINPSFLTKHVDPKISGLTLLKDLFVCMYS